MSNILAAHKLRPVQAMAASMLFKHRRLMLVLPRQYGGKTELGCRLGVDLISRKRKFATTGLFLAKDKKSAKRATREKFDRLCDPKEFSVNTEQIYLKSQKTNTLFIESVDKDPDRIRGATSGWVHWSEVAFSKCEMGHSIISVFDKVIKPTLSLQDGYCLLETTLNGKNHFFDLWNDAANHKMKTLKVSLGDMVQMGVITQETYDHERSQYHPDVFRQEFDCEWVTFQGRAYPEFDDSILDETIPYPEEWQTMVFGLDWGFHPSATAIPYGFVKDGVLNIFDEHYEHKEMPYHTAEDVDRRISKYGCKFAGVGDHDPSKNEELTKRGIPIGLADKMDVMGARMQIKEALYFRRIRIHPRCKNLIRELESAVWDEKKDGEIDYDQDKVGHYDMEAALRYLVRMLSEVESDEPSKNPHGAYDSVSARAHELNERRK